MLTLGELKGHPPAIRQHTDCTGRYSPAAQVSGDEAGLPEHLPQQAPLACGGGLTGVVGVGPNGSEEAPPPQNQQAQKQAARMQQEVFVEAGPTPNI